jgi:(5-formylfuran-3-yl)methyl phosphate synthase
LNAHYRQRPAGLLLSARSIAEAKSVVESGAGWLDVKEPLLGSLGRPDKSLIQEFASLQLPVGMRLSFAGGEISDWIKDDLLESYAASLPSKIFLKVALSGCDDASWRLVAAQISSSLLNTYQLILGHYADASEACSPAWGEVIDVSKELGCKYVLIDTFKKQRGLLDYLSVSTLETMIQQAVDRGLQVALAGSIQLSQIPLIRNCGAAWIGLRSAVCENGDRTSQLCPNRIQQALVMMQTHSRIEPKPHVIG